MTDSTHADLGPLGVGSDEARRISDAYTLHLTADPNGSIGQWMAFRLSDGECDPTLYESKPAAMRAKDLFGSLYGYMQILPTGCNVREAESYLRMCRMVAENPRVRWRNHDTSAPDSLTDRMILPFRKEFL